MPFINVFRFFKAYLSTLYYRRKSGKKKKNYVVSRRRLNVRKRK